MSRDVALSASRLERARMCLAEAGYPPEAAVDDDGAVCILLADVPLKVASKVFDLLGFDEDGQ